MMIDQKILCLDLEGTLISSAVSQFPRPKLKCFIENLLLLNIELKWFSLVPAFKICQIIDLFIDEDLLPKEALNFEIVDFKGNIKDLKFVSKSLNVNNIWILDDQIKSIHPNQLSQYIKIKEWDYPYDQNDNELEKTFEIIKDKMNANICN